MGLIYPRSNVTVDTTRDLASYLTCKFLFKDEYFCLYKETKSISTPKTTTKYREHVCH
eukprot:m.64747 g.64747  ORF g.64747 m.64747 type:complete len:58 (-) comp23472_c1_seq1:198-371(-)